MSTTPPVTEGASSNGARIYWRLLGYLKPHWLMFSLSILGFLLFAATQPALAQMMEYLINAIESSDASQRVVIPLVIVGIYLVRGIGFFVGNYFIARVSLGIVHQLRTELFNRLTVLPGEYFDRNNSGHLISRITFNVTQVTQAATDALKVLIREGFTVIGLLIYLFWKDWKLTLVFLVVAPFIGGLVAVVGKRLRKLSSRIQVTMGNVTQTSSEMINGYRVMRSFGGEDYERQRFEDASRGNFRQNLKLVTTSSFATPVLQLIVAAAMGALVYLAMTFMNTDNAGAFVAYITAAGLIPKPVRQLSEVNAKIQKGIAAAESIFEQLDELAEEDEGELNVARARGAIQIRDLSFSYNEDDGNVLHDINLDIQPGETVALVGRSGSGKTTLASLIPRFYHHGRGDILLDGQPVQAYTLASLRRQIALVNQDVTLFNDTVARNIAYGDLADKTDAEIRAVAESANATAFIEQMPDGFDTVIGEDGTRLSGGQRQRLAIARALLKDAPILILDEATSALDTESERSIQNALEEVMKGRTTLVIAHRLSTIENADKIVVMEAGRVVEQGSHQALLERGGAYAKLHAMQFQE
ncbi:lipid A export permease/ATP-binding protein MsbA [Pseudomaricurvus alkylphenolicus]|uniref:lipid A export permease/ATP-binding protein MsbA n=1 Tax=Pseudomaricurvus alkylphenolicus TaxID=1306991 RepID=UPI00141DF32C|nr:lipid A export permease/ATP-binding protein MsbA [Pseudomaricurvus alkylphenolicus]NIB42857.1 lipid A export permease/ATP-binding protein MsbA [Pseudomaricurvus alkylphenolicus]